MQICDGTSYESVRKCGVANWGEGEGAPPPKRLRRGGGAVSPVQKVREWLYNAFRYRIQLLSLFATEEESIKALEEFETEMDHYYRRKFQGESLQPAIITVLFYSYVKSSKLLRKCRV